MVISKEAEGILKADIQINAFRRNWNYIRKRNQKGEIYWQYEKFWKRAYSTKLSLANGKGSFPLDLIYQGEYLLTFAYEVAGKIFKCHQMHNNTGVS